MYSLEKRKKRALAVLSKEEKKPHDVEMTKKSIERYVLLGLLYFDRTWIEGKVKRYEEGLGGDF
jgi:hypothetical protein